MSQRTPDFYTLIHKAIRLALSDYLVLLGATDAARPAEWAEAEAGWRRIKRLLDAHSLHEDTHIHPLIHIAAPAVAERLDAQHETLDEAVRALDRSVAIVSAASEAGARHRGARDVYLGFSRFMAEYFQHLIEEETEAMPALSMHFAPAVLFEAHHRLIGSIPPEEKLGELPFIARSLSTPERIGLMLATQAGAPPAFFAEASRIMAEAIGVAAFAPVAAALGQKAA